MFRKTNLTYITTDDGHSCQCLRSDQLKKKDYFCQSLKNYNQAKIM